MAHGTTLKMNDMRFKSPKAAPKQARDRSLRGKARIKARKAGNVSAPTYIFGPAALAMMKSKDLIGVAKQLGMKGYSSLKVDELRTAILHHEENVA